MNSCRCEPSIRTGREPRFSSNNSPITHLDQQGKELSKEDACAQGVLPLFADVSRLPFTADNGLLGNSRNATIGVTSLIAAASTSLVAHHSGTRLDFRLINHASITHHVNSHRLLAIRYPTAASITSRSSIDSISISSASPDSDCTTTCSSARDLSPWVTSVGVSSP